MSLVIGEDLLPLKEKEKRTRIFVKRSDENDGSFDSLQKFIQYLRGQNCYKDSQIVIEQQLYQVNFKYAIRGSQVFKMLKEYKSSDDEFQLDGISFHTSKNHYNDIKIMSSSSSQSSLGKPNKFNSSFSSNSSQSSCCHRSLDNSMKMMLQGEESDQMVQKIKESIEAMHKDLLQQLVMSQKSAQQLQQSDEKREIAQTQHRIRRMIAYEQTYDYKAINEKLLSEAFDIDIILATFGQHKNEIDNLIAIFRNITTSQHQGSEKMIVEEDQENNKLSNIKQQQHQQQQQQKLQHQQQQQYQQQQQQQQNQQQNQQQQQQYQQVQENDQFRLISVNKVQQQQQKNNEIVVKEGENNCQEEQNIQQQININQKYNTSLPSKRQIASVQSHGTKHGKEVRKQARQSQSRSPNRQRGDINDKSSITPKKDIKYKERYDQTVQ